MTLDTEPRFGADGLLPVIAQDALDGRVLMLGYADAEALVATAATGELHFHSRSRDRLWRKGETSGNVLRVQALALDCDGDAILATVQAHGPTCHRGTRSCFDPAEAVGNDAGAPPPRTASEEGFAWLEELWATIAQRASDRPAGSYTTSLLDGGVDVAGRKVTEEATELLMAAKDDAAAEASGADRSATQVSLAGEAADLVYHALVLLAERGQTPSSMLEVLQARHTR
jgi:phosphoribosyl-ATP pyrophosphohydrolase/phosphoribosyl-AMP cyclohydrolase